MGYIEEAHYKEIDVIHVAAVAVSHLEDTELRSSPVQLLLEDSLKREGSVKVAIAHVELVLEFHPVEAKSVQTALQNVHLQ